MSILKKTELYPVLKSHFNNNLLLVFRLLYLKDAFMTKNNEIAVIYHTDKNSEMKSMTSIINTFHFKKYNF